MGLSHAVYRFLCAKDLTVARSRSVAAHVIVSACSNCMNILFQGYAMKYILRSAAAALYVIDRYIPGFVDQSECETLDALTRLAILPGALRLCNLLTH